MEEIKKTPLYLNELVKGTLTDKNYYNYYNIKLKKTKCYFIELFSKNDYEFNLNFFDKKYDKIQMNSINYIEHSESKDVEDDDNIEIEQIYLDNLDPEYIIDHENEENNDILVVDYSENKQEGEDKVIEIIVPDEYFDSTIAELIENEDIEFIKSNRKFNNKIYIEPKESTEYNIMVSSDYLGQEGEYELLIKEVENIKLTSDKKLNLNEMKVIKFTEKYKSLKFKLNLESNKTYKITNNSKHIRTILYGNNKLLTDNENNLTFKTIGAGNYFLDLFGIKDNVSATINIQCIEVINDSSTVNSSSESYSEDYESYESNTESLTTEQIIAKEIILLDEQNNKYKLFIKNNELKVEKYIN